jgi:hypothetical protein
MVNNNVKPISETFDIVNNWFWKKLACFEKKFNFNNNGKSMLIAHFC